MTLPLYNNILVVVINLIAIWLGFLVYRNNPKEKLNRTFVLMVVTMSFWVNFGYFARSAGTLDTVLALLFLKIAWFVTPLFSILLYFLVIYLLDKESEYRVLNKFVFSLGLITAFVTGLTNFVVAGIDFFYENLRIVYGPGMIPFLGVNSFFIFATLYLLFKQYLKSSPQEKRKIDYFLLGIFIFYLSNLIFNIMLPVFFRVVRLYWIGDYSTVFILGFTAYAIVKRELFGIRIFLAQALVVVIAILLLWQALIAIPDWFDFSWKIFLAVIFSFFGRLLIKSVLREVRQREKMEKMAGELEVAYGGEKLAKERVEEAKAEDEALLGSIGDGVVAVDKEGRIMFVNRAAEDMLGVNSGQAIGRPYEQILEIQNEKGEVLDDGKSPIHEVLNLGKKVVTDAAGTPEKTIYFVRRNKTKFPAAITVAPVILQGRTIGAINVFRDVTVERQIDKSKSEFVSLASHQLRTPLTTIKWYSEMLADKKYGTLNPKQKEYLDVIYQGNMRMVKLIDIMLDVSRLDAGKIKIREELVDLKKIADVIIAEEKFNIKKQKQKFVFVCEEKNPQTLTDPNQLRIVFQNVISNAVKYTPTGGKIECSIKREGDSFLFSIKDSGIGIPEAQQKRIFEKLFRADNAFAHQPDGNGLGLYAAKATIENLGGKIWFESEEGKGTTFYVAVPIKISK